MLQFLEALKKSQGKSVTYVLRNMLRMLFDSQCIELVNQKNSVDIYKMFLLVTEQDFSAKSLAQFYSSNVVLSLFEMALFN